VDTMAGESAVKRFEELSSQVGNAATAAAHSADAAAAPLPPAVELTPLCVCSAVAAP
jgi:hypothetical protein